MKTHALPSIELSYLQEGNGSSAICGRAPSGRRVTKWMILKRQPRWMGISGRLMVQNSAESGGGACVEGILFTWVSRLPSPPRARHCFFPPKTLGRGRWGLPCTGLGASSERKSHPGTEKFWRKRGEMLAKFPKSNVFSIRNQQILQQFCSRL